MLLRGLKRKYEAEEDDSESCYRSSLRHFQNASRRRESIRIKTRNEVGGELSAVLELEKRLSVETSLLSGVNKFLREPSQGLLPCLEAAKTLKTSELRRDMLKYELNKLKRGQGRSATTGAGGVLPAAAIGLIPRGRKKPGAYAVFCLARIGSQIYDTGLLYPIQPGEAADVAFEEDLIFFSRVPHYFELVIEVYSYLVNSPSDNSVIQQTPRKIARSISRAVGKSLLKRSGGLFGSGEKGPKFELIATANLTLEDVSADDLNHTTSSESLNHVLSSAPLPLFARPYCCEEEVLSGPLLLLHQKRASSSLRQRDSGLSHGLEAESLGGSGFSGSRQSSLIDIPVSRETTITDKRGSLQSAMVRFSGRLSKWFQEMSLHASNHRKWKQAAEMRADSPESSHEKQPRSFKRTRSKLVLFYNDV
ncbi:Uncharacterized protein FKW44_019476 [Caligus rogercresseyi]|uniref:Anillin homology domain-containing protein n=1 Tax=Caligus rogercresseyi TaxID=217165 RepID=A0A7T8GVW0_CALRO|nr:Uncharacterized protein FKW44_019476 [Caligus rogercresseyi]